MKNYKVQPDELNPPFDWSVGDQMIRNAEEYAQKIIKPFIDAKEKRTEILMADYAAFLKPIVTTLFLRAHKMITFDGKTLSPPVILVGDLIKALEDANIKREWVISDRDYDRYRRNMKLMGG